MTVDSLPFNQPARVLAVNWSLPPARRETNGWKWPLFMLLYLFGLAYIFTGITYWSAVALGL